MAADKNKGRANQPAGKRKGFKDLPIIHKLSLSHTGIVFMAMILAICGLIGIWRVTDKVNRIYSGPMMNLEAIGDLRYNTSALENLILQSVNASSVGYAQLVNEAEIYTTPLSNALDSLHSTLTNKDALAIVDKISGLFAENTQSLEEMTALLSQQKKGAARTIYENECSGVMTEIRSCADQLNDLILQDGLDYYEYSKALSTGLTIAGIILIILTLMISTLLTTRVSKVIADPVQQITKASQLMQVGDLSAGEHITCQTQDELGILSESMRQTASTLSLYINEISGALERIANGDLTQNGNALPEFLGNFASIRSSLLFILDRLNSTISNISSSAEQVSAGSRQIADGSQTLAQGASEQASAVQDLTVSINDISNEVTNTAQTAAAAKSRADEAGHQVTACTEQMSQMISAMNEIDQKSVEINKIIKTIDDIAFQTNILALNAAVEAARAGAAGKGFAVVANEVRSLAGKSAEASQNTASLINDTVSAVHRGSQIAQETAQALSLVADSTRAVSTDVDQIAITSNQEAEKLFEIANNIEQISQIIQTTSSTAEQSAAASEELSGQADILRSLVSQFHLKNSHY